MTRTRPWKYSDDGEEPHHPTAWSRRGFGFALGLGVLSSRHKQSGNSQFCSFPRRKKHIPPTREQQQQQQQKPSQKKQHKTTPLKAQKHQNRRKKHPQMPAFTHAFTRGIKHLASKKKSHPSPAGNETKKKTDGDGELKH